VGGGEKGRAEEEAGRKLGSGNQLGGAYHSQRREVLIKVDDGKEGTPISQERGHDSWSIDLQGQLAAPHLVYALDHYVDCNKRARENRKK